MVAAGCAACELVRSSCRAAFARKARAMTAPDVLAPWLVSNDMLKYIVLGFLIPDSEPAEDEIGPVFEELCPCFSARQEPAEIKRVPDLVKALAPKCLQTVKEA